MSSTPRRTVGSGVARGRSPRGWCPRHDHVYPFRDGVCPDCGTSLVAIDLVPRQQDEIEIVAEPPVEVPTIRSPRAMRMIVVGLVLAAFTVGLVLPRPERRPARRSAADEIAQSVGVGGFARSSGVSLRLSRLAQRGLEFNATISTVEGTLNPLTVVGAAVEVVTQEGTDLTTVSGVSDVRLSHVSAGLALAGRLPSGVGKIVEFRISSLQLRVAQMPEWDVNISSVWPTRGAEPKVLHVGTVRSAGAGRRLRLVAVLAWHDRLEVDLGLPSLAEGAMADLTIDGLEMTMSGEGDGLQDRWTTTLGAVQQEQISPTEILARFEGIPHSVHVVTIRAARLSRFLAGPWSWRIA